MEQGFFSRLEISPNTPIGELFDEEKEDDHILLESPGNFIKEFDWIFICGFTWLLINFFYYHLPIFYHISYLINYLSY